MEINDRKIQRQVEDLDKKYKLNYNRITKMIQDTLI